MLMMKTKTGRALPFNEDDDDGDDDDDDDDDRCKASAPTIQ